MDFQDVAFLSSQGSFSTTFPENCCRCESLGTTAYLEIVVGGMQGHFPCKTPLCQSNFVEIGCCKKMRLICSP